MGREKVGKIFKCENKYYKCIDYNPRNMLYLWQPIKRFLWFYIKDLKQERFWLDGQGFEEVKKEKVWKAKK